MNTSIFPENERKRISVYLSADAAEALLALSSERKQGEFLSRLILEAKAGKQAAQPGILERIETKLDRVLAEK